MKPISGCLVAIAALCAAGAAWADAEDHQGRRHQHPM